MENIVSFDLKFYLQASLYHLLFSFAIAFQEDKFAVILQTSEDVSYN